MQKLKKVLRPGGDKDDEIMYGTPQKVSEQPPQLATDPEAEKESHGILRQVLNPGGEKYSNVSYGTTAHETEDGNAANTSQEKEGGGIIRQILNPGGEKHSDLSYGTPAAPETSSSAAPGTRISSLLQEDLDRASCISIKSGAEGPYAHGADTPVLEQSGLSYASTGEKPEDSNLARDSAIGGVAATGAGAAAYEGIKREDNGDDVSKATYTARSYPLSAGTTSDANAPVDSSQDRREAEEEPSTVRDTSLAGAGTLIGAGAVGAGALAAQEDKNNDPEVEKATYTDRAYAVGSSGVTQEGVNPSEAKAEEIQPQNMDSASKLGGHMPGEFPTESGDDPHVPGGFPTTPGAEKEEHSTGTGAAIASAMGLTVGGATAAGVVASSKSDEPASQATEKDLHPGGHGFPYESSQTTSDDSNKGKIAAVAGGTAAAVGAAGAATYAALSGGDKKTEGQAQEWKDPPKDVGGEHARNLKTVPPTKDDRQGSALGKEAAVAGGAGAAAAGAGGLYFAEKNEDKSSAEPPRDVGRDHAEKLTTVPATKDDRQGSALNKDAAVAGGAVAAAGAAGGAAAYAASRDGSGNTPQDVGRDHAKNLKTVPAVQDDRQGSAANDAAPSTVPVPQEATKDDVEDSNMGRDAAIAGGATAAAAAAGGAAYYASKDEDPAQEEGKQSLIDKAKQKKDEKKEEKEQEKQAKQAEKDHEKAMKEKEKEEEKRRKEEEKNMSKEEKKDEERRKKEEWEKLNAERLAAYQKGELGPEDVLKDGQQPIADKEGEMGFTTAEEAVAGGLAGATAAAVATGVATRDDENRTSTDEQDREKKPSLMQKILHPNKTRKEEKERRASMEARSSQDSTPKKSSQVGTDSAIGDSSSSAKAATSTTQGTEDEIQPVASSSSGPSTRMLAAGERAPEGYITITHAGADPDAPHLVVKDH